MDVMLTKVLEFYYPLPLKVGVVTKYTPDPCTPLQRNTNEQKLLNQLTFVAINGGSPRFTDGPSIEMDPYLVLMSRDD